MVQLYNGKDYALPGLVIVTGLSGITYNYKGREDIPLDYYKSYYNSPYLVRNYKDWPQFVEAVKPFLDQAKAPMNFDNKIAAEQQRMWWLEGKYRTPKWEADHIVLPEGSPAQWHRYVSYIHPTFVKGYTWNEPVPGENMNRNGYIAIATEGQAKEKVFLTKMGFKPVDGLIKVPNWNHEGTTKLTFFYAPKDFYKGNTEESLTEAFHK